MAPRKTQPWAKVRAAGIAANKAKNLSATPHSAWRALTQQNNEHEGRLRALIDRKEEEAMFEEGDGNEDADADDDGEREGGGKKKLTTKSKPNPKLKKITKRPTGKGKTSKPTTRPKRILDDNDDASASASASASADPFADPESWRPYGGEALATSTSTTISTCIGLARLSSWQYPTFKASVQELLDQYTNGAELEAEECSTKERGGEGVMDVLARFGSEEQAGMILGQVEGEVVVGRKMQVRFVED